MLVAKAKPVGRERIRFASPSPDTLAIRLQRVAFDQLLAEAVHSTYKEAIYGSKAAWKQRVAHSDVRLQWDPDHHPSGARLERRAIQLGLRGEALAHYAREWLLEIEDISDFVRQQYEAVRVGDYARLITPQEQVYPQPAHTKYVQIEPL